MRGGARPGAGRKPGIPNKVSTTLKEAILLAADKAGGEDGMAGYLAAQAAANPTAFMGLLGKVLPMQEAGGASVLLTHGSNDAESMGIRVEFVRPKQHSDDDE